MESAAPFTLLAVAAGYLFTKLTHLTSFRIRRLAGYHLLFESAIWGIVLVIRTANFFSLDLDQSLFEIPDDSG